VNSGDIRDRVAALDVDSSESELGGEGDAEGEVDAEVDDILSACSSNR